MDDDLINGRSLRQLAEPLMRASRFRSAEIPSPSDWRERKMIAEFARVLATEWLGLDAASVTALLQMAGIDEHEEPPVAQGFTSVELT